MKNNIDILWETIEKIIKYFIRILPIKIDIQAERKILQFVQFCIVGASNVVVSYTLYLFFLCIFNKISIIHKFDYIIAEISSYICSIFWAFYWNWKYVFKGKDNNISMIEALIKTFASYSFSGIILNSVILYICVQMIGIHKLIAPIVCLLINIPINFLLNKFWAFKKK